MKNSFNLISKDIINFNDNNNCLLNKKENIKKAGVLIYRKLKAKIIYVIKLI